MRIKVIKNGFTMEDAFERLYKRSKHFTIENMDLLFYLIPSSNSMWITERNLNVSTAKSSACATCGGAATLWPNPKANLS